MEGADICCPQAKFWGWVPLLRSTVRGIHEPVVNPLIHLMDPGIECSKGTFILPYSTPLKYVTP